MCGRGTQDSGAEVAERIHADLVDGDVYGIAARPNLAPTDPIVVLRRDAGKRRLFVARWGMHRAHGRPTINARDDKLATPAWRGLTRQGRVVVPLRGFYELDKTTRQPGWFTRTDAAPLLLAGLLAPSSEPRVVIVTTAGSEDIADLHDRMPAVLEPGMVDAWLSDEVPAEVLVHPAPAGTLRREPGAERIASAKPASRQGSLF